jgi:hypothetical protein
MICGSRILLSLACGSAVASSSPAGLAARPRVVSAGSSLISTVMTPSSPMILVTLSLYLARRAAMSASVASGYSWMTKLFFLATGTSP